jgi:hypothetical protein
MPLSSFLRRHSRCTWLPMSANGTSCRQCLHSIGHPRKLTNSCWNGDSITTNVTDMILSSFHRRHSRHTRLPMSAIGTSCRQCLHSTGHPRKHKNSCWNGDSITTNVTDMILSSFRRRYSRCTRFPMSASGSLCRGSQYASWQSSIQTIHTNCHYNHLCK